uniref:ORF49c n=1 Tax=Pinus koraiensis TaxID=88728 RepID=A4QML0_PINKO|nr:ORF49c [Pinus koraiensis]
MFEKRNKGNSNGKILERKNTSKMDLFPCNNYKFLSVSSWSNLFLLNSLI